MSIYKKFSFFLREQAIVCLGKKVVCIADYLFYGTPYWTFLLGQNIFFLKNCHCYCKEHYYMHQ